MAITLAAYREFMVTDVPLGYIESFTNTNLGSIVFNISYTQSGGPLDGKKVRVRPFNRPVEGSRVQSGLLSLAGGRIYNPWGLAGKRAPVAYPTFTQRIIYTGYVELVMQYYEKLLGRAGLTGDLSFSYGRRIDGTFDSKYCEAQLIGISGIQERNVETGTSYQDTWIELSATWQQTGAFTS